MRGRRGVEVIPRNVDKVTSLEIMSKLGVEVGRSG